MKLLICGPQGSGKTTQARILSQTLDLCLIKTGDLVRSKSQEDSEVGKHLREALETGQMANNPVVSKLVQDAVSDCDKGFVVDGYPRLLEQLDLFDPGYDAVVYLHITEDEAYTRLIARGREDDTPEVIAKRLEIFEDQTTKVVEYYRNQGILISVDGMQSVEKVTHQILEKLKERDGTNTNS